ncbi:FMN-dependent dehydrogenase-domain-containing protein [Echria macrotheca]|uniref:FMN-dependent dehydrogenase-domain-containing protein n=1 Tax=Echria macrotheca TaxID=438768 RepID=A0AAJ0BAI8_9PEZI|nr:FMN-dependent dehydrogenase-domain-containing protein [Echria macrotheca]
MTPLLEISPAELAAHNTPQSAWIAINSAVYDVTDFVRIHPGGASVLLGLAGRDGTDEYKTAHPDDLVASVLGDRRVGVLTGPSSQDTTTTPPPLAPPEETKTQKPPLNTLISTHDFRRAAQQYLPPRTLAFISSAATDSQTHHNNTKAYSLLTLRPLILRNVTPPISLATSIQSHPVSSPIFACPTSMGLTVHSDGESAIARACASLNMAQVISTSASSPLSSISHSYSPKKGKGVWFYQLYVNHNLDSSKKHILEAVRLGAQGVWVTLDAPVLGKREADLRQKGIAAQVAGYISPSASWDSLLPWLTQILPPGFPIVLKGVQTAADAKRAWECRDVKGIVISNHGGRSLDTSTPAVLVLLELHRCCPEVFEERDDGTKMEVYVDGGIWRGTDVFKALCLGARAVGVGRGVLYALGYGEEGVRRYFEILNDELKTTMQMCGITSLDQVHPGFVNTRAVDHLIPDSLDHDHHPYIKWRPHRRTKL